jgi:pimeloyl-ACP methyl ester carboxylesterase
MTPTSEPIIGRAAGVPFLAVPPAGGARAGAPVVLAWHLMDAPRTEAAFAAAVPLDGLDAWRIYLGLPLSGSRMPAGGWDEVMRLAYVDAVLKALAPAAEGAAEELGPAYAELRERLELDAGPVGVMGGSIGAAAAQLVLAEGDLAIDAAVLISPVVQLRRAVEANERRFETTYAWSDESNAAADRLDFVARADDIARNRPAVLLVVGEQDDVAFHESAAELRAALRERYSGDDRAQVRTIPGMGHALADEPGMDPAPQTPHAAAVDRHAVEWFRRHLTGAR